MIRHIFLVLICIGWSGLLAQPQQSPPPHAILLNGTALVPIRALANEVGATISIDTATRSVVLTQGDHTLRLTAYSPSVSFDRARLALPVPPIIRSGQLYVPVRDVATAFGGTIAVSNGTSEDSAKRITVTYGGNNTLFRLVEDGRFVQGNLTGGAQNASAFAVANVPGIDQYNSPYLSDIVPLDVWAVQGTQQLWRRTLAKGVSITQFTARDFTGNQNADLLLTYFTRHSYMGPYPGSIYHTDVFHWAGGTFHAVLSVDYSRDHGRLQLLQPNTAKPATFILTDTNWQQNEDITHTIIERYTWNGNRFTLTKRPIR